MEELNLRTRIMFGSLTSLFTAALEGQKRQCLTIWSDVGLKVQDDPIDSFFLFPDHRRLSHRPTPDHLEPERMSDLIDDASKLFFARCSVPVKSTIYTIGESAKGMTTFLAAMSRDESLQRCRINGQSQEKHANSFISEIVGGIEAGHPFVLNATIVPTRDEMTRPQNKKVYTEKDIMKQNSLMRRMFIEQFALMAIGDPAVASLFSPYKTAAKEYLSKYLDGKLAACIPKPKEKPKKYESVLSEIIEWWNETHEEKQMREEKWFYESTTKFDHFVCSSTARIPKPDIVFNEENASNPRCLEFYFAYFALNHKESNYQTKASLKFSNQWSFKDFQIGPTVYAHSVYNQRTSECFREFVNNNGLKKVTNYSENYVHETFPHSTSFHQVCDSRLFCGKSKA